MQRSSRASCSSSTTPACLMVSGFSKSSYMTPDRALRQAFFPARGVMNSCEGGRAERLARTQAGNIMLIPPCHLRPTYLDEIDFRYIRREARQEREYLRGAYSPSACSPVRVPEPPLVGIKEREDARTFAYSSIVSLSINTNQQHAPSRRYKVCVKGQGRNDEENVSGSPTSSRS